MKILITLALVLFGMLPFAHAQEREQNSTSESPIVLNYLDVESILEKWSKYPFIKGYVVAMPMEWAIPTDSMVFSKGINAEPFVVNDDDHKSFQRYMLNHNVIDLDIQQADYTYHDFDFMSINSTYSLFSSKVKPKFYGQLQFTSIFRRRNESEAWMRLSGLEYLSDQIGLTQYFTNQPFMLQGAFNLGKNLYPKQAKHAHFFVESTLTYFTIDTPTVTKKSIPYGQFLNLNTGLRF